MCVCVFFYEYYNKYVCIYLEVKNISVTISTKFLHGKILHYTRKLKKNNNKFIGRYALRSPTISLTFKIEHQR